MSKLYLYLMAGAAVLAIIATIYFEARWKQKQEDMAKAKSAIAAAELIDARAKGAATAERASDSVKVEQLQKDLTDAYSQVPDDAPAGVQLALACQRLRGTASARLPEFTRLCGPQGGVQAPAGH